MTLPLGYKYSAMHAGIRKTSADDLALIVSDALASAAAVFTTNVVQAAPVRLAREHLKRSHGIVRAVLVNAGNANCATRTGDAVAQSTCKALAAELGCPVEQVFPASTGVIGVEMDPAPVERAIPDLCRTSSPDKFENAARAMLTTDTDTKVASEEVALKGGSVRIAGMTKGAGMIHPRMATTLGFVMTDASIPPMRLKALLNTAIQRSYNRISVDGDTSTNDTVLLLANGAARVATLPQERGQMEQAMFRVFEELARKIVRDGEGARKLITIEVEGAVDDASAERMARAIANSPLVKTAIAGSDPNWGRILAAAGYSGAAFDPATAQIELNGVLVCRDGLAAEFEESDLKQKLNAKDCLIRLTLGGSGRGRARFWTCDLTEKYIEINASYRT